MPPSNNGPGSNDTLEIRVHGRGGQGGVTCAKIIASVYSHLDKSVQTFGDYAGERSGAPVRAYTRISDRPITNRNKVYNPDQLIVLDPSLLAGDVMTGLKPGGLLLLNSPKSINAFRDKFPGCVLAVVDATEIARRHKIGTRSVVIVNTSLAGAYAKMAGLSLDLLQQTYSELGLESNFEAARDAYEAVVERPVGEVVAAQAKTGAPPSLPDVMPLDEHHESPPTGLKTGSWSAQRPLYMEKIAPCNAWCPAGNDVVRFLQTLLKDGETAAARVLAETSPFAAVCGRVCPAPCMEGCNRREYDGSVNIRALERWIADRAPVAAQVEVQPCENPFRVAIVGSGPAGLTAAYHLAKAGHKATVYEGEEKLGGLLRTGIPSYRLPKDVVDREIEAILALGVEARTGDFIGPDRLQALAAEFDALIVATGLTKLRALDIDGSDLEGTRQGVDFLHEINMAGGLTLSGRVVVLGGGFTAMDCARTAFRCGASHVTVAYRRTLKEIPISGEEYAEAQEEGVEFLLQRQPVAFTGNGRIDGVDLVEVEMGEPDEDGRRRPVLTDRRAHIECDHVLLALGQSQDLSNLPEGWQLDGQRIRIDGDKTNVFAAGGLATWEGTVPAAIGNGYRVAGLVMRSHNSEARVFERPSKQDAIDVTEIRLDHFPRADMTRDTVLPVEARKTSFEEVNSGISSSTAEVERCFSCGHCTHCDTCLVYCPEGIVRRTPKGYAVNFSYCKGCGICVEECPRGAMEMKEI